MADILLFPAAPAIPDQEARTLALDTRSSCIVEAPAGSGKTGLLMQRFLRLLADENTAQPEEVLAITFTRKATAELRARVLEQLEAAHNKTPLPDTTSPFDQATRQYAEAVLGKDRQFAWGLLDNPNKLRIRTIDSLCAEIANTLPLLSGGSGGRTPVEDAFPLYRLAARRTLMLLGGADRDLHNALATVLLHRDASLADCEALLAGMLQSREQWAELVPLDRGSLNDETLDAEVRPRLESALENIVCAGLTRALQALPGHVLHELTTLAQRLSIEPGYKGNDSPIAVCAGLHTAPEARAEHLDHWTALINLLLTKDGDPRKGFAVNHLGFTLPKAARPLLETLIADISSEPVLKALCDVRTLPSAHYPDDQWHVAKALFRLLLHALAELKVLFAERNECDFAELALAAREALESETGAEDLANSSGGALRHLLVDEMQDTSSAQYQLLELLTRSWDGHSQTLFLVGDPKQSIYLFRQARVERFLRTMNHEHLGDVPLRALRLTSNFRSQQTLVESFNSDFGLIFPSPEAAQQNLDAGDVPFVAASAVRKATAAEAEVWHTTVLSKADPDDPSSNPKRDHALQEAVAIRSIIEEWRGKPLPEGRTEPWRIAVLARARNHLAPIVAEFQRTDEGQQPIPFRAVKVEALRDRQEVLDVLALTRALLHPADRAAWLAVLHGPWCGLGLADLLALTGEGAIQRASEARAITVASLIESRSSQLSDDGQQLLNKVWPALHTAQAEGGRSDIATLVERTWRSLGGDAMLKPEQRINVRNYFALLRKVQEAGNRVDLRALNSQLDKLFAEPSPAEDAVDLMTIHSAKGLEWDVVLIPSLEKRGQITSNPLLNWLELDGSEGEAPTVVLAPIQRKGEQASDLSRWLRRMNTARETAERKRLLYVACTRAREALHLFAACEHNAKGELKPAAGTLLESAWPVAQTQFSASPVPSSSLAEHLSISLQHEDEDVSEPLALAASAAPESPRKRTPPLLHRLPLNYDPRQRFLEAAKHRLPHPPAVPFDPQDSFERPEGSFAVRAFGNVVHRFLQLIAAQLADNGNADALLQELDGWQSRLFASIRAEGLPANLCKREAARALGFLKTALTDPDGRWILMPHPAAGSESALTLSTHGHASTLRVDRTFLAGTAPGSTGEDALWIVDFKTSEQGSRNLEQFIHAEQATYGPQLSRYAELLQAINGASKPIILGLYYPSIPRLIHWHYQAEQSFADA